MEETICSRLRDWLNTGPGRWVAIGVVLALVGVTAAVFLRDTTEADADAIRAKGHKVLFCCKSCEETGEMWVAWNAKFPQECPKCGKMAAVLAFKCIKCGNIIESRKETDFTCPRCGHPYHSIFAGQDPLGPTSGR